MTTNLQKLYKEIIDSAVEEKLKYAFLAMIETAVVENEEVVKTKIKRMLDEYIANKDTEAKLLARISQLEKPNTEPQTVQSQVLTNTAASPVQPLNTTPQLQTPDIPPVQQVQATPVSDAQAIADIQNQLQSMPSASTSLPS